MNGKGKYFIISGIAACVSLLLLITTTYGADITIGGDYTDIGTIIFVSPKPGDSATANGTALLNTLNGITDASETNPYLIKLGPGIYDLGTCDTSGSPPFTCVVYMKPYVSIEGSGEKATKITAAPINTVLPPAAGTVMGADNAELRSLTVETAGTSTYSAAIMNVSASPSIMHVTATASGATSGNTGVYNATSSPVMINVTATGIGGSTTRGVYNFSSSPVMTNVTATGSGGSGNTYGVANNVSSAPVMTNVTATASGGNVTHGVSNTSSSPVMTNVTATGSGGSLNAYGVSNNQNALPVMTNVTATASGGAVSYGLFFTNYSSATTILIDRSTFEGGTNSIYNTANLTLLIGASKLAGPINNLTGTFTCAASYNGSYVALGADCLLP
jgi:hypothetical protein